MKIENQAESTALDYINFQMRKGKKDQKYGRILANVGTMGVLSGMFVPIFTSLYTDELITVQCINGCTLSSIGLLTIALGVDFYIKGLKTTHYASKMKSEREYDLPNN